MIPVHIGGFLRPAPILCIIGTVLEYSPNWEACVISAAIYLAWPAGTANIFAHMRYTSIKVLVMALFYVVA